MVTETTDKEVLLKMVLGISNRINIARSDFLNLQPNDPSVSLLDIPLKAGVSTNFNLLG